MPGVPSKYKIAEKTYPTLPHSHLKKDGNLATLLHSLRVTQIDFL